MVCNRFRVGQILRVPWHHNLTWEHVEDPNKGDANVLFMDEPMRHPAIVTAIDSEGKKVKCLEFCGDADLVLAKSFKPDADHRSITIRQERWFPMIDCETYRDTDDCVTFEKGGAVGVRVEYFPYNSLTLNHRTNATGILNAENGDGQCL